MSNFIHRSKISTWRITVFSLRSAYRDFYPTSNTCWFNTDPINHIVDNFLEVGISWAFAHSSSFCFWFKIPNSCLAVDSRIDLDGIEPNHWCQFSPRLQWSPYTELSIKLSLSFDANKSLSIYLTLRQEVARPTEKLQIISKACIWWIFLKSSGIFDKTVW